MSLEDRLSASARDFQARVWPLVREHLGGGELVPVESVSEERFAQALDTLGMTDAWQIVTPIGIRGLATRIQWGEKVWQSWTVRKELRSGQPTEFDKITLDGNWHRPSYVIQSYLSERGGEVLASGCIALTDLRNLLLRGIHGQLMTNPIDGNKFVPVWWSDAERQGCRPWIYPPTQRSTNGTSGESADSQMTLDNRGT